MPLAKNLGPAGIRRIVSLEVLTMWNVVDRRVERSEKLDQALGLLLRVQRRRGELELILLATLDGMMIAWDGPTAECEELAAYAPLLTNGSRLAIDPKRIRNVTVYPFTIGKQDLVLLIRGRIDETLRSSLVVSSIQGTARI